MFKYQGFFNIRSAGIENVFFVRELFFCVMFSVSDIHDFLSFFLLILARSNFDHYARECNFGILKKKTKTKQKNKNKTKKQKNLSAVFLTK